MILRLLSSHLREIQQYFPALYLGGPRQSGKTTLLRRLYPDFPYASLENPDTRLLAERDPRRFLESFPQGAILDEAQRVILVLARQQRQRGGPAHRRGRHS